MICLRGGITPVLSPIDSYVIFLLLRRLAVKIQDRQDIKECTFIPYRIIIIYYAKTRPTVRTLHLKWRSEFSGSIYGRRIAYGSGAEWAEKYTDDFSQLDMKEFLDIRTQPTKLN